MVEEIMRDYVLLAYHRILPDHLANERGNIAVSTSNFERQLQYLISIGWQSLTLLEFYNIWLKTKRKPKQVFVVTFDDGYSDNYTYAFPILKKYNVKATFFLVANTLSRETDLYFTSKKQAYQVSSIDYALTKEQIEEMLTYGYEFGSHTLTHPKLTEISLTDAEYEIGTSKTMIEQYLGEHVHSFCYPYGNLNRNIISLVENVGYKVAVVSTPYPEIPETVYTLRRTGVYLHDSFWKFKMKCSKSFYYFRETKLWKAIKG